MQRIGLFGRTILFRRLYSITALEVAAKAIRLRSDAVSRGHVLQLATVDAERIATIGTQTHLAASQGPIIVVRWLHLHARLTR